MTNWEKERLTEQLKLFGAKKTKFISVYAKKPRVRMVNAEIAIYKSHFTGRQKAIAAQAVADARGMDLYQQQAQLGMLGSALGLNQMQQLNSLMGMSNGADMARGQAQFGGLGGIIAGCYG